MTVTEGDDEQDSGMDSAPVRRECLQGKAVPALGGSRGASAAVEVEQVRWWLHFWVGLGLPLCVPWLGERGGEQGLVQVPSCHAGAGGGWWEFISLREHWHQKGILFCWYLLMTSPFLPLLFI